MNGYHAWNAALCGYLTAGVPRGRPVFMHVDASVLAAAARMLPEPLDRHGAEAAFCAEVRAFVCPGGVVDTGRIRRIDVTNGVPLCVAFLAATVLAATQMRDDEDASEGNYFLRLREVLGMPAGPGRPAGMESGGLGEQPLWWLWNRWLQKSGWLPTASPGEGPRTYIQYPISQALLRVADADRLRRIFALRQWRQDLEPPALVAALTQPGVGGLSSHLRELLSRDGESRQAVYEALHEFYEVCRSEDPAGEGPSTGLRLRSGLMRSQDLWSGEVCYCYYPQTSRHARGAELVVEMADGPQDLRQERPGWYEPLGEVSPSSLTAGVRLPVHGDGIGGELILPPRRFWILVPDPDDPESGAYATWDVPRVGDPFVLLLRESLLPDVQILHDEGLFRWAGPPRLIGGGWLELRRCESVSEVWSEVFIADAELKEALRPISPLGLRLSGGLRAPGGQGWMDGAGPSVEVSGFSGEVDLRIVAVTVDDEHEVLADALPMGTRRVFAWPGPGDYRVEASVGPRSARQLVKINAWETLRRALPERPVSTDLPGARVMGACILPRESGGGA